MFVDFVDITYPQITVYQSYDCDVKPATGDIKSKPTIFSIIIDHPRTIAPTNKNYSTGFL